LGFGAFSSCIKLNKITFLNLQTNPTYGGFLIFNKATQGGKIHLQNCDLDDTEKTAFLTYLDKQGLKN
jgi:hypothetical protein